MEMLKNNFKKFTSIKKEFGIKNNKNKLMRN